MKYQRLGKSYQYHVKYINELLLFRERRFQMLVYFPLFPVEVFP